MSAIDEYLLTGSPEESNWRSVILFGRNAASYKFALAQALIDLAKQDRDSVTLDQLADPYTRHLCEHLAHSPKQSTGRSSKFIDACSGFNNGEVTHDALIATAVQLGFNNVLDAFHIVNQGDLPVKFFEKDFSRGSKRLILTDEVFKLANSNEAGNIIQETESRWNLVETAWEQGISSSLLRISYDELGQAFMAESGMRRKDVTSARGSLNGYQKGHCFYCYAPIDAADGTARGGRPHPAQIRQAGPLRRRPFLPTRLIPPGARGQLGRRVEPGTGVSRLQPRRGRQVRPHPSTRISKPAQPPQRVPHRQPPSPARDAHRPDRADAAGALGIPEEG